VTNSATASSGSVVWSGRPWILPSALTRTIIALIVASVLVWLEYFSGTASDLIVGTPVLAWTVVVFLIIWLLGLTGLLVERATNLYTLNTDSLEIRTGIFTSHSFVIVASGFSDLEVIRGVVGRIIEYGDIIIRTQNERNPERTMIKVREPLKVAEQIRYVMGRPIVRLEDPAATAPRP
jgi:membrane protein YdbS with pleckstrin-like domain